MDGSLSIGETKKNKQFVTNDRRLATSELARRHIRLSAPPPIHEWGPGLCESSGKIDQNDYIDKYDRRMLPKRKVDIYFDPCAANVGLPFTRQSISGFKPPKPIPTENGCLKNYLYEHIY